MDRDDDYIIEIDNQDDVERVFATLRKLNRSEEQSKVPGMAMTEGLILEQWLKATWSHHKNETEE
ncbi:MAG: hypothetical protein HDQ87_04880 [Clostridia bacterium]|nr:hypothetical protein [Clostridia bacterium]